MPGPLRSYIAMGSNIEPEMNVPRALHLLAEQVEVVAISTLYWVKPLERSEQPDFLNGVCAVEVTRGPGPRHLKFEVLRPIERALGRVRTADKHAERTIDLDLLLFGELVLDEPDLVIPDPELRVRPFLAIPLLEIAPDLLLPGTREPLREVPAVAEPSGMKPEPGITQQLKARFEL